MNSYFVYIKSHAETPDYEASFPMEEIIMNMKCLIPYYDEGKCGGKLQWVKDGLKCEACNQVYIKE